VTDALEWRWEPPYRVARFKGGHYAVEGWDVGATLTSPLMGILHFDTAKEAIAAAEDHNRTRTDEVGTARSA
jgi:hypothetical protein